MSNFFDKYELYTNSQSIYCYPDSTVLVNKLNITNWDTLRLAETQLVAARLYELEYSPLKGSFDIRHLYDIHEYIFQDCYDFAGKTRMENISKGNTQFCLYNFIEENLSKLFSNVTIHSRQLITKNEKIEFLSYIMSELNIIHPFREGNGRAIREFVREYALNMGLTIKWAMIDREKLMDAMIESVLDDTLLKNCLNIIID
ncbi:MAG: Fic family protein [Clostridia bacterium]|nr:Fic family protein [Clostridia bacterium]